MISALKISDTVEICVPDKDNEKRYFRTKIEDISLDDIFYTMVPTSSDGRLVMFSKGATYDMFLHRGDGVMMWKIKYVTTTREDNRLSCQFQAVSGPEVTQRREFYRQPVSIDSKFIVLEEKEESGVQLNITPGLSLEKMFLEGKKLNEIYTALISQDHALETYDGRIIDISGGGCAFVSNTLVGLQSKLLLSFTFRGTKFEIEGLVLDRMKFTNNRTNWDYRYRIQWINFKSRDADGLIRLVFAEQREMLINNGTLSGDRFV